MNILKSLILSAALVFAMGCSSPVDSPLPMSSEDAGFDAGSLGEADAAIDAGADSGVLPHDAGSDAGSDSGTPDAGEPFLGTVTGACGTLATNLSSPDPSLVNNLVVYMTGEAYERSQLSPGGQRLFDTPNAGGSSGQSEVVSFEVLHRCEGAALLKTETEVTYDADAGTGAITDYLMAIGPTKYGVSVTRALNFPFSIPVTDAQVETLLKKKLEGIQVSSMRVSAQDRWAKQILHIFAIDQAAAESVARVWPTLDSTLRADTVVLVTRTQGGGFIYCDPDPPLGSECQ